MALFRLADLGYNLLPVLVERRRLYRDTQSLPSGSDQRSELNPDSKTARAIKRKWFCLGRLSLLLGELTQIILLVYLAGLRLLHFRIPN